MNPKSPAKLDALTGLRYIAALTVLLTHMAGNFPEGAIKKYTHSIAGIGMSLFFVLSGFLMVYNYSSSFQTAYRKTLWRYVVARFARIYPIYIIALFFWLSVVSTFFNDLKQNPSDTQKSLLYIGTMTQSWVHIPVFVGTPGARTVAFGFMGVAWSVSTEVFFYLVFPFVVLPMAALIRRGAQALVAGLIVYMGFMLIDSPHEDWYAFHDRDPEQWRWLIYVCPYIRLGEFLLGGVVGQYFVVRKSAPITGARNWWIASATLAACIVVLVRVNYFINSNPPGYAFLKLAEKNILLAPACAGIIYFMASLPCMLQRVLGSRPMVLLGNASYAMYLMHPVFQWYYGVRVLGEGTLKNRSIIIYNNVALFVSLHIFCLGMYTYVEVPLRDWIRHIFDGRKNERAGKEMLAFPGAANDRAAA